MSVIIIIITEIMDRRCVVVLLLIVGSLLMLSHVSDGFLHSLPSRHRHGKRGEGDEVIIVVYYYSLLLPIFDVLKNSKNFLSSF